VGGFGSIEVRGARSERVFWGTAAVAGFGHIRKTKATQLDNANKAVSF
jgi:hypothetical protein